MKTLIGTLALVAMCFAAWFLVPSSVFVQPLSLRFDGERFLFVRETPRGPVWGVWRQELRGPGGACSDSGDSFYEDVGVEPTVYPASERLARCIPGEGEVFVVHVSRMVILDGWFPLRPSDSTWSCVVGGPDCVSVN